jgi:hypothetical protein
MTFQDALNTVLESLPEWALSTSSNTAGVGHENIHVNGPIIPWDARDANIASLVTQISETFTVTDSEYFVGPGGLSGGVWYQITIKTSMVNEDCLTLKHQGVHVTRCGCPHCDEVFAFHMPTGNVRRGSQNSCGCVFGKTGTLVCPYCGLSFIKEI